jgi:hypothetical protein
MVLVVVSGGWIEDINLSYTILLFNINFKLSEMELQMCKYQYFE